MPGKLNGCCQLGEHGSATGGWGMAVSSLPEAGSLPRNRSMWSTQIRLMDMDEYMDEYGHGSRGHRYLGMQMGYIR